MCTICAAIDFAHYFRSEVNVSHEDSIFVRPSSEATKLGYLSEIYQRSSNCSFCRLVINAICKRWLRYEWVTPEELLEECVENGRNVEYHIYSYLFASDDSEDTASMGTLPTGQTPSSSHKAYRIGIGAIEDPRPYIGHAGDIQLLATSAAQIKESLFHGRALNPERVDITLARKWLRICEIEHGDFCEVPAFDPGETSADPFPEQLFVVDVREMCLRELPQEARYIALSYCWPQNSTDTFMTTASSVSELLIPGALNSILKNLPPVVCDTIRCVDELGETYLWVDALCIIQDVEEHRRRQIQQMDRIYSAAFATIICAPPDSSLGLAGYDGLPGYRSGSRISPQDIEEVQGLALSTTFLSVDLAIMQSRWSERAWTFQEHRLSKRKLFFTEMQLYFQCSCNVYCEDAVGEGSMPFPAVYPGRSLSNTSATYADREKVRLQDITWISRSPYESPVERMNRYSSLLDQYSPRQMSNPGDIIFAFQGILSLLQRVMKTDFWAGLPEAYFDEALLWIETGPHIRRSISEGNSTTTPFPSWSWAGWDTEVKYDNIYIGFICPEVDWFMINQSGVAIRLTIHGAHDHPAQRQIASTNKVVRQGSPPQNFLESVQSRSEATTSDESWELPRFLACWTSIAEFRLTGESFELNGFGGTAWDNHENMIISDTLGRSVGSIILGKDWKAKMVKTSSIYEFMLLSRSNIVTESCTFFDEDKFPPVEWCFLNVMLIEREEDRARVIHENPWVEAAPNPMLIKLE